VRIIKASKIEGVKIVGSASEDEIHEKALEMIAWAKKRRNPTALGLAACQVGIFERFFVAKIKGTWGVFINPVYKPLSCRYLSTQMCIEECLSYRGEKYAVRRYVKIFAAASGYRTVLNGIDAIVFQHETDHCNGITIKMIGVRR